MSKGKTISDEVMPKEAIERLEEATKLAAKLECRLAKVRNLQREVINNSLVIEEIQENG